MENQDYRASLPFFGIPRLFPYMRKYRKTLLIMLICGLLGTGVDLVLPLLQRYALNHYIANRTLDTLPMYVALYVVIILFGAVVNFISTRGAMSTEVRVNRDLRSAAFDHLQKLSFSYFNQNAVGYIHSRVMSDTGRIGSLVSWTMMDSVWHTSYLIGSIIVMLVINARLALMVMVIGSEDTTGAGVTTGAKVMSGAVGSSSGMSARPVRALPCAWKRSRAPMVMFFTGTGSTWTA